MSAGGKFRWLRSLSHSDLPAPVRGTLRALAEYADGSGGNCYPSVETISRAAGVSLRTARRHLQVAEQRGWLQRIDRSRLCKPNLYVLAVPLPAEVPENSRPPVTETLDPRSVVTANQPENNQLGHLGAREEDELSDEDDAAQAALMLVEAVGGDLGDWRLRTLVRKRMLLVPRDDRVRVFGLCLGPPPEQCDDLAGLLLYRIKRQDRANWNRTVRVAA